MLILRSSRMIAWHHAVVRYFWRQSPRRTAAYVVAYTAIKVFRLAAMLLPFKILSLARRDDVPAYATSFMTKESKPLWVVGLAVATLLLYLLTLVLDAWNRRTAHIVARRAYVEADLDDEDKHDDSKEMADLVAYFTRICSAYGDLGFLAIVFTGASLINPVLFFSVAVALMLEVAALGTWLRVRSLNAADRDRRLTDFWQRWSSAASALNYFVGFAIMLVQFLWFGFNNALVAIVSILMLRQILSAVSQYVNHGLWLWRNKARLMSLIDTGRLNVRAPNPVLHFQKRFRKNVHHKEIVQWLNEAGDGPIASVRLSWVDPHTKGMAMYFVHALGADDGAPGRTYFERIDFPKRQEIVAAERELRKHAVRLHLPMPPRVVTRKTIDEFECAVYEIGPGRLAQSKHVLALQSTLLARMWAARLEGSPWRDADGETWIPSSSICVSSIRWRLLGVAAENKSQCEIIQRTQALAEELQALVDGLPRFIFNENLHVTNIYVPEAGEPFLLDWTAWKVTPLGVGLHLIQDAEAFAAEWLESDAAPRNLHPEHLLIASGCERLCRDVSRQHYAAAIKRLRQILKWYERLATV